MFCVRFRVPNAIRGQQDRRKGKPSLVGGQPTDPVFTRLYPYKFSRQKLPVTVSTTAVVAATEQKIQNSTISGISGVGRILDWNKAKRTEDFLNKGEVEDCTTGNWNTSTLVVKERVAQGRKFSVIY